MGRGSGSYVMQRIIHGALGQERSYEDRKEIYRFVIPALRKSDWDTEMGALGIDEAYDDLVLEKFSHFEEMEL